MSATAFHLTPKQQEAQRTVMSGDATHIMLFGGGRSGKTFLNVRNTVVRAIKSAESRHMIARFRFNHVKASIILETFPAVMSKCFPEVEYVLDKQEWYVKFANKAEIWFAGLDDKERTEKLLGKEYATVYLNECSQISWDARNLVVTRLAQKCFQQIDGAAPAALKTRMYYDCNPPSKAHWTFRLFKQKVDPETRIPVSSPADYVCFQMNPRDNMENLSPEYLKNLAGLSARVRRRFEEGEFADATPNALFDESVIDKWRVIDGQVPDFVRIVVAVDPSGSGDEDNADNDEIGLVVAALGTDGNGYVLEDISLKGSPATWGRVATSAYERHKADVVVGEVNYGGEMVRSTIQTARKGTPFKKVTATRGKAVRAEPFSALYEQGRIRHVGIFSRLEDELCAMSTAGYTGSGSPNRADALIWALSELFPGIVSSRGEPVEFVYESVCA
jgi:hypothetical protein